MVKASVEQELANGNGNGQARKAVQPQGIAPQAVQPQAAARSGEKASNKQIKFITDICSQRGMSLSDLNADVQRRFGVAGLYDLSRREASALLDELNSRPRKAA